LVAAVVYFLVVLPYSKMRSTGEDESADDTQTRLLTEIRDAVGGKDTAPEFEPAINLKLKK